MHSRLSIVLTAAILTTLAHDAQAYFVHKLTGPREDIQSQVKAADIVAKVHVDSVEQTGKTRFDLTPAVVMVAHCTVISAIKGDLQKTLDIPFQTEEVEQREYGTPRLKKDQTIVIFQRTNETGMRFYGSVPVTPDPVTYNHGNGPFDKMLDELLALAAVEGPGQKDAIEQLGYFADPRAGNGLAALLEKVKPELRAVVVTAMIRSDAAPPFDQIKKYIRDPEITKAIYERSASPVNDPATGDRPQPYRRGLTGLDYAAYLRECLPLVKPEQVEAVMYAVWQVNRLETVPVLVESLNDKSADVRRWAVGDLRNIVGHDNKVPDAAEFARTGEKEIADWKKWWAENGKDLMQRLKTHPEENGVPQTQPVRLK